MSDKPKYEDFYSYSDDQLRRKGKTDAEITEIRREQWPDATKQQIVQQVRPETVAPTTEKAK